MAGFKAHNQYYLIIIVHLSTANIDTYEFVPIAAATRVSGLL